VVVGEADRGAERPFEAVVAHGYGHAIRFRADVGAAAGEPRFGVGSEPAVGNDDPEQLSLWA
jgi:hypothetical protein